MSVITGNNLNNLLDGTNDADTIYGLLGDDTINGYEGDDLLIGDDGIAPEGSGDLSGNLLNNGGFESPSLEGGAFQYTFDVPSWVITSQAVAEVQNQHFYTAVEGNQWLELDSDQNYNIAQTVETSSASQYVISLEYSPRPGHEGSTSAVEVYWNGQLLETLTSETAEWSLHSYTVTGGSEESTIEFRGAGASDFFGGLIDDVSVREVRAATTSNDTINGGAGNDLIYGGFGNDVITDDDNGSSGSVTPPVLGENLIVNGGFEAQQIQSGWYEYSNSIPGWSVTFGDFTEVQNQHFFTAIEGNQWVELDSYQNTGIAQNVATATGQQYVLSFDYSARPGHEGNTSSVEVVWNGAVIGTLANAQAGWTEQNFTVTGGVEGSTLEFRAAGASDFFGALIDDVSVRSFTPGSTVEGGAGDDTIYGGANDDRITLVGGENLVFGDTGNDTIYIADLSGDQSVPGGANTIYGGEGNDQISSDINSFSSDVIYGDAGNDAIQSVGNDTIYGGDDNDTIYGNVVGNRFIDGGDGNDLIIGALGSNLVYGGLGNDTYQGTAGLDTVFGGEGADFLYSNGNNDIIYGEGGDDYLYGATGAQTIFGGEGVDVISAGGGNDVIYGDAGNDFIFTPDGQSTIYGGAGIDQISGGSGDEVIYGGTEKDDLRGGGGNDQIFGESGTDAIWAGGDNGTVVFGTSELPSRPSLESIDKDSVLVTNTASILSLTIGDTVTGGADRDAYLYQQGDGVDFISDFNRAEGDFIKFLNSPGLQTAAEIVYRGDGNTTIVFSDGVGGYLANSAIVVSGIHALGDLF